MGDFGGNLYFLQQVAATELKAPTHTHTQYINVSVDRLNKLKYTIELFLHT